MEAYSFTLDTLYVLPIWQVARGGLSTSRKKCCKNYFRLLYTAYVDGSLEYSL